MAGPRGEFVKERAGDPGEYHHSRNLTKKIAVGSKRRNESSKSRGEFFIDSFSLATRLRPSVEAAFCAAKLATAF